MDERLGWIRRTPARWAHWHPLRGGLDGHRLVAARYPQAEAVLVEATPQLQAAALAALRPAWWQAARWRGGALVAGVPAPGSVELVWNCMALHAAPDPQALLAQWHTALATDGFLMLACLGPDSLQELRAVYAAEGWGPPGPAFTDMHDWGDMLVAAGFAEPVMDMERLTLTFDSPARLVDELRGIGRNLHPGRFARLRGRGFRAALEVAIDRHGARDASGQLVLTVEVAYGHAFKPAPRVRLGPESSVPLESMRALLREGRGSHG
jgi:malonyl-CoA O-methyltransferase